MLSALVALCAGNPVEVGSQQEEPVMQSCNDIFVVSLIKPPWTNSKVASDVNLRNFISFQYRMHTDSNELHKNFFPQILHGDKIFYQFAYWHTPFKVSYSGIEIYKLHLARK